MFRVVYIAPVGGGKGEVLVRGVVCGKVGECGVKLWLQSLILKWKIGRNNYK